jgi:hypothetical protein
MTTSNGTGDDVILQDAFEEGSSNSRYVVPMEPPILVQVTADEEGGPSVAVQVGRLRKYWRICEYEFLVTINNTQYEVHIEFCNRKNAFDVVAVWEIPTYAPVWAQRGMTLTSNVGTALFGRPRTFRNTGLRRRLRQTTSQDAQVYDQDPFSDDTGLYGADAFYEVSVNPPLLVPVVVDTEEISGSDSVTYSVRVNWLRKFWDSCEYEFYFTPPGKGQVEVSGQAGIGENDNLVLMKGSG